MWKTKCKSFAMTFLGYSWISWARHKVLIIKDNIKITLKLKMLHQKIPYRKKRRLEVTITSVI